MIPGTVCDDYYSLWLGQKMAFGDVFTCTSPMLKYIGSSCYFQLLLNVKETNLQCMSFLHITLEVANRPSKVPIRLYKFCIINSPEQGRSGPTGSKSESPLNRLGD